MSQTIKISIIKQIIHDQLMLMEIKIAQKPNPIKLIIENHLDQNDKQFTSFNNQTNELAKIDLEKK